MRLLSALLIVLLCFAVPAPVFAETSDEAIEKAQAHFSRGAEFYALGDYSKAIVEFLQGHNLAPNAMFLYNISLSYERLDNLKEARNAATKARNFEGMPAEVSVRNEARITSFGVALIARDIAESQPVASPATDSVSDSAKPESESTFGALGWTGAAVTAIGATSLIFALVLNQQVAADLETINEARDRNDFDEANRLTEDVNSTRTTGIIFLFSGIGLTAIGLSMVVWDLLDDDSPDESGVSASIAPTARGDGAVVGVGGTF